jgi:hypothetical protein
MRTRTIVTLLTGAVVAGESLALFLGTHVIARSVEWAVRKNTALIALDVIGGAALIWMALQNRSGAVSPIFYLLAALLIVTHGYRVWEVLTDVERAFCANPALFWFNNVRLPGLLVSVAMSALQKV